MLVGAQCGADGFLSEDSTVEPFRRIVAHVAVVTVFAHLFAEITHQDAAAAHLRLGIALHLRKFFGENLLESRL